MKTVYGLGVVVALIAASARADDSIDRFIVLRDKYMESLPQKRNTAKKELNRVTKSRVDANWISAANDPKAPLTYPNQTIKTEQIKNQKALCEALQHDAQYTNDPSYLPEPKRMADQFIDPLQVHEFGRFPYFDKAKIIQRWGDDSALAEITILVKAAANQDVLVEHYDMKKQDVILAGVDLKGIADDAMVKVDGIFEVSQTKSYDTALGSPRTVMVLQKIDMDEVRKRLAARANPK